MENTDILFGTGHGYFWLIWTDRWTGHPNEPFQQN